MKDETNPHYRPFNHAKPTLEDYQAAGFEVISVYTDDDAVTDGVLVDIAHLGLVFQEHPVNRLTCGLYEDLRECLPGVRPETDELRSMLWTKLQRCYFKGDIWQVPPGWWLMDNEISGWTLMRPEDY
ncbi:MAG: hypothetical protein V3W34_03395 [Phycisphaerae bacterium]